MTDQQLCQLVREFSDRFENTCMGQIDKPEYAHVENHPGNDFNWVRGIRVKDLYEFARAIKREVEGGSTNQ